MTEPTDPTDPTTQHRRIRTAIREKTNQALGASVDHNGNMIVAGPTATTDAGPLANPHRTIRDTINRGLAELLAKPTDAYGATTTTPEESK